MPISIGVDPNPPGEITAMTAASAGKSIRSIVITSAVEETLSENIFHLNCSSLRESSAVDSK